MTFNQVVRGSSPRCFSLFLSAVMAELADATGLGPVSSDGVQVQVLLTAREFIASRLVLSGGFFMPGNRVILRCFFGIYIFTWNLYTENMSGRNLTYEQPILRS